MRALNLHEWSSWHAASLHGVYGDCTWSFLYAGIAAGYMVVAEILELILIINYTICG